VIMTKLDGTAKGGALVQVAEKFRLPIPYVGIGEGEGDLQDFDAKAFARALAGLED
jgi:fused signal recognition particle receptor